MLHQVGLLVIFTTFIQNDSMRVLINKPIASFQTDSAFYHGFVREKVKTCFLFSNISARIKKNRVASNVMLESYRLVAPSIYHTVKLNRMLRL